MVAMGGVGFTITALVEILGAHRYHPFLRPAVLMGLLCYTSAIMMLMVELGRPWMVWMILVSWAPTSALYKVGWCAFLYLNVLVLEFVQVPVEQLGWGRALRHPARDLHSDHAPRRDAVAPAPVVARDADDAASRTRCTSCGGRICCRCSFSSLPSWPVRRWRSSNTSPPRVGSASHRAWICSPASPASRPGSSGFFSRSKWAISSTRGAAGAMLERDVVRPVLLGRDRFRPAASVRAAADAGGAREPARARHRMRAGHRGRIPPPVERGGDRLARAALGNLHTVTGRDRHHPGHYCGGAVCVRLAGAHPADPRRVAVAATSPHPAAQPHERIARRGRSILTWRLERPPRFPAFRIVVMLVVLVNLILTIALITQVRELSAARRELASGSGQQARRRHATAAAGARDPPAERCGVS